MTDSQGLVIGIIGRGRRNKSLGLQLALLLLKGRCQGSKCGTSAGLDSGISLLLVVF